MQTLYIYFIGILVLALGWPIGEFLKYKAKDEIKSSQAWFKAIIIICLIGSLISSFFRNDVLFFSFLFIAVVTSRSLSK